MKSQVQKPILQTAVAPSGPPQSSSSPPPPPIPLRSNPTNTVSASPPPPPPPYSSSGYASSSCPSPSSYAPMASPSPLSFASTPSPIPSSPAPVGVPTTDPPCLRINYAGTTTTREPKAKRPRLKLKYDFLSRPWLLRDSMGQPPLTPRMSLPSMDITYPQHLRRPHLILPLWYFHCSI